MRNGGARWPPLSRVSAPEEQESTMAMRTCAPSGLEPAADLEVRDVRSSKEQALLVGVARVVEDQLRPRAASRAPRGCAPRRRGTPRAARRRRGRAAGPRPRRRRPRAAAARARRARRPSARSAAARDRPAVVHARDEREAADGPGARPRRRRLRRGRRRRSRAQGEREDGSGHGPPFTSRTKSLPVEPGGRAGVPCGRAPRRRGVASARAPARPRTPTRPSRGRTARTRARRRAGTSGRAGPRPCASEAPPEPSRPGPVPGHDPAPVHGHDHAVRRPAETTESCSTSPGRPRARRGGAPRAPRPCPAGGSRGGREVPFEPRRPRRRPGGASGPEAGRATRSPPPPRAAAATGTSNLRRVAPSARRASAARRRISASAGPAGCVSAKRASSRASASSRARPPSSASARPHGRGLRRREIALVQPLDQPIRRPGLMTHPPSPRRRPAPRPLPEPAQPLPDPGGREAHLAPDLVEREAVDEVQDRHDAGRLELAAEERPEREARQRARSGLLRRRDGEQRVVVRVLRPAPLPAELVQAHVRRHPHEQRRRGPRRRAAPPPGAGSRTMSCMASTAFSSSRTSRRQRRRTIGARSR